MRSCLRVPYRLKPGLHTWDRARAMTPCLNVGIIPFLAVVADGIFLPHALGFRAAHVVEVFRGTAPSPLGPSPHVAMMRGVVVNVVNGREEVALGAHETLSGVMEDLSSAFVLLPVPTMARATMKSAQFIQELENVGSFNQCVVMVWQHTPGNGPGGVPLK